AEFGVRRPALQGMALGEPQLPSWADPAVREAFASSVADEPHVTSVQLAPGDPEYRLLTPELDVVIVLPVPLQPDELRTLISRLQEKWQASDVIADRVDSMRVIPRVHEGEN